MSACGRSDPSTRGAVRRFVEMQSSSRQVQEGLPELLHPRRGLDRLRCHCPAGPLPQQRVHLLQRRHPGHGRRRACRVTIQRAPRSPAASSRSSTFSFSATSSAAIGLADLIVSRSGSARRRGRRGSAANRRGCSTPRASWSAEGVPATAPHKLPYALKLPPSKPFNPLDLASRAPTDHRGHQGTSSRQPSSASAPSANCSRGRSSRP